MRLVEDDTFSRAERLALLFIVLVFLVYSSQGVAAPFWWGHYGYHGAEHMLKVRMSLRFHMLEPARWTGYDPPPPGALYLHRPIGYHYLLLPLRLLFGEHEWVARLGALIGALFGLYGVCTLARRAWSPRAGVAAALIFVGLPIVGSFGVLPDPNLLVIGLCCFTLDVYLRFWSAPDGRLLARAAMWAFLSSLFMWEPYFAALPLLAVAAVRLCSRRERAVRVGRLSAPFAYLLAVGGAFAIGLLLYIAIVTHAHDWANLREGYRARTSGTPFSSLMTALNRWLAMNYGRPPLVLGSLWLSLFVVRTATGGARARDIVPLVFLFVNVLYLLLFPTQFVLHAYLVFFLLGFFIFAIVDLASDLELFARRRWGTLSRLAGPLFVFGYLAFEAPHTYRNLVESRATMGTQGFPGYSPQQEKLLYAQEITRRTNPADRIFLHLNVNFRKEFWYYMDRSFDEIRSLADIDRHPDRERYLIAFDARALSAHERNRYRDLVKSHPLTLFGSFALLDLRKNDPGLRCYQFVPQKSSAPWSWFVSARYPPLALVPTRSCPGLADFQTMGVSVLDR